MIFRPLMYFKILRRFEILVICFLNTKFLFMIISDLNQSISMNQNGFHKFFPSKFNVFFQ